MRKSISCLVVMPVGPKSKLEYVRDTVESYLHYFDKGDSLLLILDDTRRNALEGSLDRSGNIIIINAQNLISDESKTHNTRGMLFVKQVLALRYLARNYKWKCLLRLDDDALVTGPNPHLDALEAFGSYSNIGILGAYFRRGDGEDKRPALRKQGRKLVKRIFSGDIIRNPKLVKTLFTLIFHAKLNGYKLGDMCTGGSLFLSGKACNRIERLFGSELENLLSCDLADDLLLALCTGASGFRLKDFSDPEDIMAINWRGLPMPLEELVARRKKLLHPVKETSDDCHEQKVREYFKTIRSREKFLA